MHQKFNFVVPKMKFRPMSKDEDKIFTLKDYKGQSVNVQILMPHTHAQTYLQVYIHLLQPNQGSSQVTYWATPQTKHNTLCNEKQIQEQTTSSRLVKDTTLIH